ncbi:carboxypeptidase-like regulatory domain-containing protein [uncultured Algoriphagus sp.]|uniref:carboxypeptidase-like regulatory domain-containing protein n=1 Tax=uncultured Algoriphagus sp. TaxID=417365 RepID=UPI0030EEB73F|tara:strand:+ start:388 stop:792 length:405 start_codon:yes stop_codon:yes gene_type:complete
MKNTLTNSHKRYQRKVKIGFLTALFLFIGGFAFSISKLTSTADTEELLDKKTVKGLILSPDKKPIPGAVILVKETTTGTVTDIEGNFWLDLEKFNQETITLKISMIDYESTEIMVNTKKLPKDLGKITLKKEAK